MQPAHNRGKAIRQLVVRIQNNRLKQAREWMATPGG
jgi:hypothetical protein